MMFKRLLLLAGLVLLLVACGGEEAAILPTFTPNVTATPTMIPPTLRPTLIPSTPLPQATLPPEVNLNNPLADPARLRVIQANPRLEAVDIYMGAQIVGGRFRYGSQTVDPIQVAPGQYQLSIVPTGQPNSPQQHLLLQSVTLDPRQDALLVILGDADNLQARLYPLNLSPLPPQQLRLSVIHAVPNAPPISLTANGQTIVDGLLEGNTQANIELTGGDYTFAFSAESESLLVEDVTLSAGETYLMLLVGDLADGDLDTQVFHEPTHPQAQVRAINAVFGSGPLRVFLDEQLLVENLGYTQFSDRFVTLEAGDYLLRVESMTAQAGDPPLLETLLQLPANSQGELLLYDRPETLQARFFLLTTDPVTDGEARLTLIHALIGKPELRVLVNSQLSESRLVLATGQQPNPISPQANQMVFGSANQPAVVGVGVQTFVVEEVTADGSYLTLFESPELAIEEGKAYTYLLLGRNGGDSLLLETTIALQAVEDTNLNAPDDSSVVSLRFANALLSQAPMTISLNGEVVARNVAYGRVSPRLPVTANEALAIELQNSAGQVILQTSFQVLEGVSATLVMVGQGEAIQYMAIEERPNILRREGAALGTFMNGLSQAQTLLSMIYYPIQNQLSSPSDAVVASPTPDETQYQYVGNTLLPSQFVTLEIIPREYELQVRDDNTGQVLGRFFLTPERNGDYLYIVLEDGDGIQLLTLNVE
jgi:hypothetical protein